MLMMASSVDYSDCGLDGPVARPSGHTAQSSPSVTIFTRLSSPAYLPGILAVASPAHVEAQATHFRFSVAASASDDPVTGSIQSVTSSRRSRFGGATF
jgi:hypothetical protein